MQLYNITPHMPEVNIISFTILCLSGSSIYFSDSFFFTSEKQFQSFLFIYPNKLEAKTAGLDESVSVPGRLAHYVTLAGAVVHQKRLTAYIPTRAETIHQTCLVQRTEPKKNFTVDQYDCKSR